MPTRLFSAIRGRRAAFWLALLFLLLDCATVFADDHSFWRGSRSSGRSSGPLDAEDQLGGIALMGIAFSVTCAAVLAVNVWLLSSLKAVKLLAVFSFFSFLAGPLFIVGLIPPLPVFLLGSAYCSDVWARDPYGGVSVIIFLALAAFLYFYLLCFILAAFSKKEWYSGIFRGTLALSLVCALGGAVFLKSGLPLLLFALCVICARLACTTHKKVTAWAGLRARRKQEGELQD